MYEAAPTSSAASPRLTQNYPLTFTGNGGEYFKIWIVNLVLSILTLGIYSAWAKVRRLKYFHQHTQLDGASFDYHGSPIAILKGRIIGLALFGIYFVAVEVYPGMWSFLVIGLLLLIMPWLIRQSLRFRLAYTSYRSLRFNFQGSSKESYQVFVGWGLLTIVTLYLLAPVYHQRLKRFQHGNSFFGSAGFSFHATAGNFYKAYALPVGLAIATFILVGIAVASAFGPALEFFAALGTFENGGETSNINPALIKGLIGVMFLVMMFVALLIAPLWIALIQNVIWNNTRLDEHRFVSDVSAIKLTWILFSNFVLVVLTMGLFTPWAQVRSARYRASTMSMVAQGDLNEFTANLNQLPVSATGEESTEIFDVDIGI